MIQPTIWIRQRPRQRRDRTMNDDQLRQTAIGRTDRQNNPTIGLDAKRVLAARLRGAE
jgi:hypothetical protein